MKTNIHVAAVSKELKTKLKRGTIGWEVAKLVKRYGHYTTGHTILELALSQATQATVMFQDGKGGYDYLTRTPGYKAALESEHACYERMGYTVDRTTGKITKPDEAKAELQERIEQAEREAGWDANP